MRNLRSKRREARFIGNVFVRFACVLGCLGRRGGRLGAFLNLLEGVLGASSKITEFCSRMSPQASRCINDASARACKKNNQNWNAAANQIWLFRRRSGGAATTKIAKFGSRMSPQTSRLINDAYAHAGTIMKPTLERGRESNLEISVSGMWSRSRPNCQTWLAHAAANFKIDQ